MSEIEEFCNQCEEEFGYILKICATCGGSYCKDCLQNHELCDGEDWVNDSGVIVEDE